MRNFAALIAALCLCVSVLPANAQSKKNAKDGLTYVWVPPGSFRMGCADGDKECYEDERPTHNVQITKGFWMGQTEVTLAAFRIFANLFDKNPLAKGSGPGWPSATNLFL